MNRITEGDTKNVNNNIYSVFCCNRLIKIVPLLQILSNSTIPHKVLTL